MRPKSPEVVIFGAPLDLTSSYRRGTRFGPPQIRVAGEGLEDYSLDLDRDVRRVKVIDHGDLELHPKNLEANLARIEKEAASGVIQFVSTAFSAVSCVRWGRPKGRNGHRKETAACFSLALCSDV